MSRQIVSLDMQCGEPALRNEKNIYIVAVVIAARLRIVLLYDTVL